MLRKLNPNKSPEIDLLSPHIMKECTAVIADSPCLPLNRSFLSGQAPLAWKIVRRVYKKKVANNINDKFRSLLLLAKSARKLLRTELLLFSNSFIYLTQSSLDSSMIDQP